MNEPIAITIRDGFFRLQLPKPLSVRARALRWSIWNVEEQSWDLPMCRECYAAILDDLGLQVSDFPNFQVHTLPSYNKWITVRRISRRLLNPGTIVLFQPSGPESQQLICEVKFATLDNLGRPYYSLRDQSGNTISAYKGSLLRIVDSKNIPLVEERGDSLQLEVPWTLSGSNIDAQSLGGEVVAILADVERELIEYFTRDKERLNTIEPRVFEKLVLAIYRNHGFDVTQIGAWNQSDGGIDILAVYRRLGFHEIRLAIQCKASRNKISAAPIRELAGVLDKFKVHQGVLCTTSHFTAQAVEETKSLWRVTLEDRDIIYSKLRQLNF